MFPESSSLGFISRSFDHTRRRIRVGYRSWLANNRRDRQRRFATAAANIEHRLAWANVGILDECTR